MARWRSAVSAGSRESKNLLNSTRKRARGRTCSLSRSRTSFVRLAGRASAQDMPLACGVHQGRDQGDMLKGEPHNLVK